MDLVGPLPKTESGMEYILVVTDYFTRWVKAYAIPDKTALTVADKFVTEFVCRYGLPQQIHSDQGREFTSNIFKEMCILLDVKKTRTCPYRPSSDGLVERFNRTLQQMLKAFVNDSRNDWEDHLPFILMSYRATVQETTGCSPSSRSKTRPWVARTIFDNSEDEYCDV